MKRRLASLSPEELREVASRRDTVVMQPTFDTVFEPWAEERLLDAIQKLQQISLNSSSKEATDSAATDPELQEMKKFYKILYERVCDPKIAGNVDHMNTIFFMVSMQTKLKKNEITETDAQALVSDKALAGLVKQIPKPKE